MYLNNSGILREHEVFQGVDFSGGWDQKFANALYGHKLAFLSTGNIVGVIIWGKIWGLNMCGDEIWNYSLGVPKLQKQYPEISNYLPHFAEA